jgi:hypothetical protein
MDVRATVGAPVHVRQCQCNANATIQATDDKSESPRPPSYGRRYTPDETSEAATRTESKLRGSAARLQIVHDSSARVFVQVLPGAEYIWEP